MSAAVNIDPVICPFTVVIDSREQAPFCFRTFKADAKHKRRGIDKQWFIPNLFIPSEVRTLKTGDYSVSGLESAVAVERKSLVDLFGTIGGGRDRFVRELERLNAMEFAAVVIEANCDFAMQFPPNRAKISPKVIFRSINAWEQEFPKVHWHWMAGKSLAEHKTFRILERFWEKRQEKLKQLDDENKNESQQ